MLIVRHRNLFGASVLFNMPFLIYVTTFSIRIRSIISPSPSLSTLRLVSLFPLWGNRTTFLAAGNPRMSKWIIRSDRSQNRERSNRSHFLLARTLFMTYWMSLREIAFLASLLCTAVSLSSLNKMLTLTTIRKTANHSSFLKYDGSKYVIFSQKCKHEVNAYFLKENLNKSRYKNSLWQKYYFCNLRFE